MRQRHITLVNILTYRPSCNPAALNIPTYRPTSKYGPGIVNNSHAGFQQYATVFADYTAEVSISKH